MKNPYRTVLDMLVALPASQQVLLSCVFQGDIPESDEPPLGPDVENNGSCGCIFGTFAPHEKEGDLIDEDGDEKGGLVKQRASLSPAFSMWLTELGIPLYDATLIERENDNFQIETNYRLNAVARYNYMVDWLGEKSLEWDAKMFPKLTTEVSEWIASKSSTPVTDGVSDP